MGVETLQVTEDEEGMRLDRWFKRRVPTLSLSHLNKIVRTGQVRVDGARVKTATRLASGQSVRVPPLNLDAAPPHEAPALSEDDARDLRDMILHEDRDLIVLNKPFGLAVQGGSGTRHHIDGMLASLPNERGDRPSLVHRLDRDTSGVLLVPAAPADLRRVVVGVDPPAGVDGDACGIVAVALAGDGCAYVIEDASIAGALPDRWAAAVAACAERHRADRVVAEGNQGGAMVTSVLLAAEPSLPVQLVHATIGKSARAEPVAALYERGKVKHAGRFAALEDELCGLVTGGGYQGPGRSPDRADAAVWALTALMLRRPVKATVRGL